MAQVGSDSSETCRLLHLACAGDAAAFEQLFERYRASLLRVIARRLGPQIRPRVDASDVVQDTQLAIFERLHDYLRLRPMPFRLWVLKTAHERLRKIEHYHVNTAKRSRQREVPLPDSSSLFLARQFTADGSSPSGHFKRGELARRIRLVLAELSAADREIILLRNFDGLSNLEVAYLLELGPATAKKRYARALLRLQKLLHKAGFTESKP
jgi:RNA polymerase sigma-70 factor (ECF subfamily)